MLKGKRFWIVSVPFPVGGTPEEDAAAAAAKTTKDAADAAAAKTFTQEQLNTLLANERKKAVTQLEELKNRATTSEAHKAELEAQIEGLKKTYQTKAEAEQEKFESNLKNVKSELDLSQKDTTKWKQYFEDTIVDRDILAAAGADTFNPNVIVKLLKPDTKLVEILTEDGKPTGKYEPRIAMTKMKDGKPVPVVVTPTEAIKLMKELPEYGHLFKSTQKSGSGGSHIPGDNVTDAELARSNPEEYRKRVKERLYPSKK